MNHRNRKNILIAAMILLLLSATGIWFVSGIHSVLISDAASKEQSYQVYGMIIPFVVCVIAVIFAAVCCLAGTFISLTRSVNPSVYAGHKHDGD
jgi:hypothetical protein